ncbi:heat-inducible transcriptional repressor HrcA [Spiroplasma endosymbiont of Crioceris asparagi]|uniref:heat-inducible transcriptional repressor HrcA n=1 Tax=Spiroplasma endosymbiont of Crioceris asparagi TaxID=3066286 RepID=UPI0030D2C6C5
MLTDRQNSILKVIVDDYIRTATPVGSKRIMTLLDFQISSATIRNESVILEEKGFLEKQHSSSGRVPSTIGYRYYVDNLMGNINIDSIKTEIEKIFNKRGNNVSTIIDQSCKIICEMTNLATVFVSSDANSNVYLNRIELVPLDKETSTIICILSDGQVKNKVFKIENEVSIEDFKTAIKIFNERLVNTKIEEIEQKISLLKPLLDHEIKKVDLVLKNIFDGLFTNSFTQKNTSGLKYLLDNPEFNNPEKIKQMLEVLENISPFQWFDKTGSEQHQKSNILIGQKDGLKYDDIAMVGKKINSPKLGKVGDLILVGPKRLQYNVALEVLEWLKNKINNEFDNGV